MMADRNPGFFVVWNPAGGRPTVRHCTRNAAQIEAVRLAKANPGEKFFVLAAITVAEVPPPVVVRELEHDMEIPF